MMAADAWYYARNGQQAGPVATEVLRGMVANGEVGPGDLVWGTGMANWAPAGSVEALRNGDGPAVAAVTPVAVAPMIAPLVTGPAPMAYYRPGGGLPPRAAARLSGHAAPLGDTGDWPLDDARVGQFTEAVKIRKRVTGAAQLYHTLLFLYVIAAAIMGIALIAGLAGGTPRGRGAAAPIMALSLFTAIVVGMAVLSYFASRATRRSQRWAPLTMFALFMIAIAINLLGMAGLAMGGGAANAVGGIFGLFFAGAFAVVSWRSYAAIPKFLAMPAWCHELLAAAGL